MQLNKKQYRTIIGLLHAVMVRYGNEVVLGLMQSIPDTLQDSGHMFVVGFSLT